MTTKDELTKIIKDYYNEQVRLGKGKSLDECNSPCIPIASIPLHLREHKINWKTDFEYDKLPDLLQSLKGIGVLRRKPCYIYVDSTTTTQEKYTACEYTPQNNIGNESKSSIYYPKDYEIRKAYRKLSTKPEEWIPIKNMMNEVKWEGNPILFSQKYKLFLQFNS